MIQKSIEQGYALLRQARGGAAVYLAASALAPALYALACGWFGFGGVYAGSEEISRSFRGGFLAYLPGLALSAWFAAGLTPLVTLLGLKKEAGTMLSYSKAWFLPRAAWDFLFLAWLWIPMTFLKAGFFGSTPLALVWMVAGIWVGIRMAVWLNAAAEGLALKDAFRRSWELTRGRVWTVVMTAALPMLAARVPGWLIKAFLPEGSASAYYVNGFFEGLGAVLALFTLAALYVNMAAAGPLPPEAEQTKGSFWGKQE